MVVGPMVKGPGSKLWAVATTDSLRLGPIFNNLIKNFVNLLTGDPLAHFDGEALPGEVVD